MIVNIIYWTGTGNTEAIARLIKQGAEEAKNTVNLLNVGSATVDDAIKADILVLGSPAMGAEQVEEYEMEPFLGAISGQIKGKKVALFGSYGWGGGEFLGDWANKMKSYGANVIGGLGIPYAPEGDDVQKCIDFGKNLK